MRKTPTPIPFGTILMLLVLCMGCVCFAGEIRAEMTAALLRCLTVIIPSLYAMMILCRLLTATGIWRLLEKAFPAIVPKLFGLPGSCFALFLLSQIAGYPVGAGMLRSLTQQGVLSRKDSQRLACVCCGSGPAFLLGLLGESPWKGKLFLLIFSADLLANLLLTAILFRRHPVSLRQSTAMHLTPLNSAMLIEATAAAGALLLQLCGMILCFSAGVGMLRSLGAFQLPELLFSRLGISCNVSGLAECFLEITNLQTLSLPPMLQHPLYAGALSFGGICVLLQIAAAGGEAVSLKTLFPARLAAGVISAVLCRLGLCLFPELQQTETAVTAMASTAAFRQETLFPSCMLLIMMLLVFREAEQHKNTPHIMQKAPRITQGAAPDISPENP